MEDALFFSSLVLNCLFCLAAYLIIRRLIVNGSLESLEANGAIAISMVFSGFLFGYWLLDPFYDFFTQAGYQQDFGHGGYAIIAWLNSFISFIAMILGVIFIGKTHKSG